MVRAILSGDKTQTRRVIKDRGFLPEFCGGRHDDRDDPECWGWQDFDRGDWVTLDEWRDFRFIPFREGDQLYVREAFNIFGFSQDGEESWPWGSIPTREEVHEIAALGHRVYPPQCIYRESDRARKWFKDGPWRPSIHMPKWASRIRLRVVEVRVQRLHAMRYDDLLQEGIQTTEEYKAARLACLTGKGECGAVSRDAFSRLWDGLHDGPQRWKANPWVYAVTFELIKGEEK